MGRYQQSAAKKATTVPMGISTVVRMLDRCQELAIKEAKTISNETSTSSVEGCDVDG